MRLGDLDDLKESIAAMDYLSKTDLDFVYKAIDNAPTIKPFAELCNGCRFFKDCETCEEKLRPQGEFIIRLKEQIEKSVCKFCQMNKHCELCEISRVFMIIDLTDKEMKDGAK